MKIIASENLRGVEVNFPIIGKTLIPLDGIMEVENELGELLVNSKIGYSDASVVKEVEQKEEDSKTKTELESLTLNELIAMCESANLPKSEWEKLSQNTKKAHSLMVSYLSKKI